MGYKRTQFGADIWQDNNYAEIYSKLHNKEVIVMASGGLGNQGYPRFLAYALKNYDIDEVFIQTTYWGRFPIAINPDLDERKIFPLDFWIEKDKEENGNIYHSIGLVQPGNYLEQYLKTEVEDWDRFPYIKETSPLAQPDIRRSGFLYMKMWHYSNTHLEQEDFMKDMTFCDLLCAKNNVKLHIWNINDRCFLPKELKTYYTDLDNTNIADIDAISFLNKKYKTNLSNNTVDEEHYTTKIHNFIAKDYIPYLKEIQ